MMLISCESNVLQAATADPPGDVLGAKQMSAAYGGAVEIDSEVGGEIVVTVYNAPEVALDYTVTGHVNGQNSTEDNAIEEALSNYTVDLNPMSDRVYIHARKTNSDSNPASAQDTLVLHVRVPTHSRVTITSPAGNITVSGEVDSANVHTALGDIAVRGAAGSLLLTTDHGNIIADERSNNNARHDLHASQGSITLFALQSNVSAVATVGSVRFVGTLVGNDNLFATNGEGNIEIALPDNMTYGFRTQGGAHVINDFLKGMQVCGVVDGSIPFDFHSRQIQDSDIGRVAVSDTAVVSPTAYVSGTMADNFYVFRTNESDVVVSIPPDQGNEPVVSHSKKSCGNLDANPTLAVNFEAHAEKGRIVVHRIRMNKK